MGIEFDFNLDHFKEYLLPFIFTCRYSFILSENFCPFWMTRADSFKPENSDGKDSNYDHFLKSENFFFIALCLSALILFHVFPYIRLLFDLAADVGPIKLLAGVLISVIILPFVIIYRLLYYILKGFKWEWLIYVKKIGIYAIFFPLSLTYELFRSGWPSADSEPIKQIFKKVAEKYGIGASESKKEEKEKENKI